VGINVAAPDDFDIGSQKANIGTKTTDVVPLIDCVVAKDYNDSYLATLFKNASKCRDIAEKVLAGLP
jgi:hypothetical protein